VIQQRVREIHEGDVLAPSVPARRGGGFTSWYERDPGEEG
jgi:hypothetical protein